MDTQPPSRAVLAEWAGRANQWVMVLLAFAIPVSVSAVSVLALLAGLLWLLEGGFRRKWRSISGNPVAVAVLGYLALYLVGLLWSSNRVEALEIIQKQWKIAMMPVFLSALHPALRQRCLYAFLLGLSITMAMTYLAWFDLLHYKGVSPAHPTRGLYHVVYNPLLAFGIYLVLHQIAWGGLPGRYRIALSLLAAVMTMNMFITEGRTGQMVFFVLLALFLLQLFRHSLLRATTAVTVLVPTLFLTSYLVSPVFQQRLEQAYSEIVLFKKNPATSVGLRLLFWRNSCALIGESPLLGVGTGDFKDEYARINKQLSPRIVSTDNPHNQYIFVLCQFGLLGLAALLMIFFCQVRQAFLYEDGWQRARLAFPVFFLVIMLAESYLVVYETAFLFALGSAILYQRREVS